MKKFLSKFSLPDIFMKNKMRRKVEANRQGPSPFEMMFEPVETKTKKAFVPPMRAVNESSLTSSDNG